MHRKTLTLNNFPPEMTQIAVKTDGSYVKSLHWHNRKTVKNILKYLYYYIKLKTQ